MKNFVAYVRSMIQKRPFAIMNVYAEEPTTQTTTVTTEGGEGSQTTTTTTEPPKPNGTTNFEDLIAKARKEERDKLYPQIEKLREEKNNLLLVVGDRDTKITDLEKQVADLTKSGTKLAKELKEGTQTNKTVSELTLTISNLERQLEEANSKYEKDVNSLKLDSYKKDKIAEANGEIIPELVTGNTEDEINASYEVAKTRYAEITQRAVQGVQLPPANPSATQLQIGQELSFDKIQSMTPSEWAEARKGLNLK